MKWARRALLLAVLAWGAWVLLTERLATTCHDEATDAGAVEVCSPLGATSPAVLLYLLVVALLLLPELSEIEIAGLVTLKRQIEQATGEAEKALTEVRELRQTMMLTNTIRNSSTVNNYLGPERAAETGAVLSDVNADAETGSEPPGAAAQWAFQAGVMGLLVLFPDSDMPRALVGYLREDDELRVQFAVPESFDDRELRSWLPGIGTVTGPVVGDVEGARFAAAPVVDDNGQALGVLAVVADPATGSLETLGITTELAAEAYARLLIDLLGESTR